jgi:hypothetical protein
MTVTAGSPLPGLHPDGHLAVVEDLQLGDLHPHAQHAGQQGLGAQVELRVDADRLRRGFLAVQDARLASKRRPVRVRIWVPATVV